ncbi:MAG: hypothetical protein VB047_11060 [Anaerotignum propionicum]|uniref:hypothetical protein n=1 Tax=Anaerotignum propionicum TaxID=28446 RepID=UPI002B20AD52|nr:hypothetical protein [Anaerotignum propionicum]MEA5058082.1 hypothetical protein [Anaerotignum propionicum]
MQKPLKVDIYVRMKDKIIPYETLSYDEKKALGIRLSRRGLQAAARVDGYELEFFNPPEMDTDID